MCAFKDRQLRLSPSLSFSRLPSDGELGMARWTLNWMSLVSQQLVCLRADRGTYGWMPRYWTPIMIIMTDLAFWHTLCLSKIEMGRYFLSDFSKLAPLFLRVSRHSCIVFLSVCRGRECRTFAAIEFVRHFWR